MPPTLRPIGSIALACVLVAGGCSGGDDDAQEISIDDQVVVDPDAVAAAREQIDNADEVEPATAPTPTDGTDDTDDTDDTDGTVEPGGTGDAPETTIAVAEAEEDELDSLLNSLTVFNNCLADDGFEFIGAPGIDGATAESFEQPYLQALGRCAAASNIAASIQAFGDAQANMTPDEIEQFNFGLPVFRECMIGLGWTVGELVPDERGALGFDGQLQPPDGAGALPTDDVQTCRLEAQQYVEENFESDA